MVNKILFLVSLNLQITKNLNFVSKNKLEFYKYITLINFIEND